MGSPPGWVLTSPQVLMPNTYPFCTATKPHTALPSTMAKSRGSYLKSQDKALGEAGVWGGGGRGCEWVGEGWGGRPEETSARSCLDGHEGGGN